MHVRKPTSRVRRIGSGIALGALGIAALAACTPAEIAEGYELALTLPDAATVGQTLPFSVSVTATAFDLTGEPEQFTPATAGIIGRLDVLLSCGSVPAGRIPTYTDPDAPLVDVDPCTTDDAGIFALVPGSISSVNCFTNFADEPGTVTGTFEGTVAGNVLSLQPQRTNTEPNELSNAPFGNVSSADVPCIVSGQLSVVKAPTVDAQPGAAGLQTRPAAYMNLDEFVAGLETLDGGEDIFVGPGPWFVAEDTSTEIVTVAVPVVPVTETCDGVAATIVGTDGRDRLVGTQGRDVIVGLGGKDRIKGLGGDDLICAGGGKDSVSGGDGDDEIFGGDGRDSLRGNVGDDEISGNDNDDKLKGGAGDDELGGGNGFDRANGGHGKDRYKSIERKI